MASAEQYNPFCRQKAKVLKIYENGNILLKVENINRLKNTEEIELRPIDKRKLSNRQRNMCWALIGEISEWQGNSKTETFKDIVNEAMKMDFLEVSDEDLTEMFSLSNAPMSLVCEYQRFLINFIIENNIPTKKPLYTYSEDLEDYMYNCLANRRCCICGKKADLHHSNLGRSRVGMGRDRQTIIHEGLYVMPLCREHHTEIHTMPESEFIERYHLPNPIKLDKNLCKILGVKATAD